MPKIGRPPPSWLLDIVDDPRETWTVPEICAHCGKDRSTVKRVLDRIGARGKLVKVGRSWTMQYTRASLARAYKARTKLYA